ncbi:hypothetical protein C8035_v009454 [Colletotrichum spinosum]|uniref:Uncharacterized protein n=1 Tax=Colletotrichum spinosum TaxID=1347390 RepID=A0A4R8PTS6_9PEZI|nr:hypothetical protein C8035_v009454 [Colletotrichum spinosum]
MFISHTANASHPRSTTYQISNPNLKITCTIDSNSNVRVRTRTKTSSSSPSFFHHRRQPPSPSRVEIIQSRRVIDVSPTRRGALAHTTATAQRDRLLYAERYIANPPALLEARRVEDYDLPRRVSRWDRGREVPRVRFADEEPRQQQQQQQQQQQREEEEYEEVERRGNEGHDLMCEGPCCVAPWLLNPAEGRRGNAAPAESFEQRAGRFGFVKVAEGFTAGDMSGGAYRY